MQFLTQPNAVEVRGDKFSPGEATDAVERLANAKRGEINGAEAEADRVPPVVAFGTDLIARAEADSDSDSAWLDAFGSRPGEAIDRGDDTPIPGGDQGDEREDYILPTIPVPTITASASYAGTIDPAVPVVYESVREYLPVSQPFDKFFVTVEGTFSTADWRAAIDSVPPEFAVPGAWTSRVELLQVVLLRERLDPETNTWGDLYRAFQ